VKCWVPFWGVISIGERALGEAPQGEIQGWAVGPIGDIVVVPLVGGDPVSHPALWYAVDGGQVVEYLVNIELKEGASDECAVSVVPVAQERMRVRVLAQVMAIAHDRTD